MTIHTVEMSLKKYDETHETYYYNVDIPMLGYEYKLTLNYSARYINIQDNTIVITDREYCSFENLMLIQEAVVREHTKLIQMGLDEADILVKIDMNTSE